MRRVVLSMAAAAMLMALPALAQTTGTTTGSSTDTTMGTNTAGTTTGSTYDNTTTTGGTYDNGTATTTTTTTTETGTTTGTETKPGTITGVGGNSSDVRTHPSVATHSNGSALTASGTIVSWNHDELVLRTSNGITHFKMMPNTVGYNGPGTFQEGQLAAVDFDRNEQGVLIARQVRLGTMTTSTTATTTTAPIENEATTTVPETAPEVTTPPAPEVTTPTTPSTTYNNETASTTTNETTTPTTTETRMPATASNSPLVALLGLLALGTAAGLRRL